MEYKTISERCEARFVEKKSEFIGYLSPVKTEEEAIAFINEIRAMHRKARHNCYAYILRENRTARHSDDGEPSGTAGVPIYEVLRKEELCDVACVVTRYFGGIMLGAGGLVRAYTRGAKDAVDTAKIKVMAEAAKAEITVDYSLYGRLPQIFADFDARTESEDFADTVKVTVFVRWELAEKLKEKLIDSCNGKAIVDISQKLWLDFA
ncbi:MAG: YigZ family protein [Oscillospiraceae bacterium]|nr:YigZ family protein [Oscillospiraceae bacterium]